MIDNADNAGTKESREQLFKKRMVRLLKDVQIPQGGGEVEERALAEHALIDALEKARALDAWPENCPRTFMKQAGDAVDAGLVETVREVRLVKEEAGEIVLSPSSVKLPMRPTVFVRAAHGFAHGDAWDEVVRKLNDEAALVTEEEFLTMIGDIKKLLQPTLEEARKNASILDQQKIVSALYSSKTLSVWPSDSMRNQRIYLIRNSESGPEFSPEMIKTGSRPVGYVNALEAFIARKPWSEVQEMLKVTTGEGGVDQALISELAIEAGQIESFEEAAQMAAKIENELPRPASRIRVLRVVHRRVEQIIVDRAQELTELKQLVPLYKEVRAFVRLPAARNLSVSMYFDILDSIALRIGREKIINARSPQQLHDAMQAISQHEFQYTGIFDAPFAESQEDAVAKLDLLEEIRRRRSESGLDELRKKVETYAFKSAEFTPRYREQIINMIEKKREVYWPKVPRPTMPRP